MYIVQTDLALLRLNPKSYWYLAVSNTCRTTILCTLQYSIPLHFAYIYMYILIECFCNIVMLLHFFFWKRHLSTQSQQLHVVGFYYHFHHLKTATLLAHALYHHSTVHQKAHSSQYIALVWTLELYGYTLHNPSLVPRLSVQLFFTTCEKKLDREPGNEANTTFV